VAAAVSSEICLFRFVMAALLSRCGHHIFVLSFLLMAALRNRAGHYIFALRFLSSFFLWPPRVADADIILSSCGFFYVLLSSSFLFPRYNLSGRRLDVYHTSTHDVARGG